MRFRNSRLFTSVPVDTLPRARSLTPEKQYTGWGGKSVRIHTPVPTFLFGVLLRPSLALVIPGQT